MVAAWLEQVQYSAYYDMCDCTFALIGQSESAMETMLIMVGRQHMHTCIIPNQCEDLYESYAVMFCWRNTVLCFQSGKLTAELCQHCRPLKGSGWWCCGSAESLGHCWFSLGHGLGHRGKTVCGYAHSLLAACPVQEEDVPEICWQLLLDSSYVLYPLFGRNSFWGRGQMGSGHNLLPVSRL